MVKSSIRSFCLPFDGPKVRRIFQSIYKTKMAISEYSEIAIKVNERGLKLGIMLSTF